MRQYTLWTPFLKGNIHLSSRRRKIKPVSDTLKMTDLPRCLPAPRSFAASPKRRKRLFIFVPGAGEDLGSGFQ